MAIFQRTGWNAGSVTDGVYTRSGSGSLSTASSSPAPAEGAGYLLHSGAGGDFDVYNFGSAKTNFGIRYYYNAGNANTTTMTTITLRNSTGVGTIADVSYDNVTGNIGFLYNDTVSGFVVVSSYAISANTWYQIEMEHVAGVSFTGKVWSQDGTTQIGSTAFKNTNIQAGGIDEVNIGGLDSPGGTQIHRFDDAAYSDAGLLGPVVSSAKRWILGRH